MKEVKIVYMDGYDEVRDLETQEVIFSTKLDDDLIQYVDRTIMNPDVIDNVVNIWNKGGNVDEYLLNEAKCTQDEREIIIESLYKYINL